MIDAAANPSLIETMNSEFISVDVSESAAAVTLNRPDKRNPLDWSTVRQLKSIVTELENDQAVHVVVVRGAGGNFSAGGDMKGYIDLYRKPQDFRSFLQDFHAMLDAMEISSKIYVAAIEGYCVAGGLELLLACDVVLAAQSARIGDAHLIFGQLPGAGGSQRLPRVVGPMRARYLMLTGEIVDAAEAERIGLVSKVVPDDGFDAFIRKFVEGLAASSPLGLKGMKHLAHCGSRMPIREGLRMELEYVHDYATRSADATEGLMAFQEKRKPRFSGT